MAFEGLSEKLNATFKHLRGKGRLSEEDIKLAMREVRLALLEADVSYKVVKDFVKTVSERAVGAEVLDSLTPAQQVIKIVSEELTALMGGANAKLTFASRPPTVVMMVGLQGAGKTTNVAKLAGYLRKQGHRPLLTACDVYRPAAITQLQVVGKQLNIPVFEMGQIDPVTIAQEAVKYVAPGDVIAIGGGTTAYVFAQHLLESQQSSGITILTNSIPVAELVQALESKDVEVIVTGGVITRSNSLVGPIADKVVASLRVNTVFLGTHSVSIPRGFLMPNSLEAATDMAMMDIADRTIVLTDHTKWSCTSLSLFARFDQVDTVITDDGLDPDSAAKTKDLVKELVLAHQSEIIEESE